MGTNPGKVAVALTGAVYFDPTKAATAPTGVSSSLDAGFLDLGGVTEDGVTITYPGSGDVTPLKYWQNGQTARTLRKPGDDPMQVKFTLRETTKAAVETAFGVVVTQTSTEGSYVDNAGQAPKVGQMVLDIVDEDELERQYFPSASVSEVGDITYNGDDSINLELTFDVDYDATLGGHRKVWSTRLKTSA